MANDKIKTACNTAKLFVKKNSPIVMISAGVAGMVLGTVLACKSVKKFDAAKKECIDDINDIHSYKPEDKSDKAVTLKYEKLLVKTYVECGIKLGKIVAPAAATMIASGALIFAGYGVLSNKHAAALGLLATEQNGFKKYRERVIEKEGQAADDYYYYGEYEIENDIPVLDAKGNPKLDKEGNPKVRKETEKHVNCPGIGIVRYFEQNTRDDKGNLIYSNPNWRADNRINFTFCKGAEDCVNSQLCLNGWITLNDAFEAFGFPKTKEGMTLVKVYDNTIPIDPIKGMSQQFDCRIYGPGTDCGESYIYDHEEFLPIHFDGFVPIDSVDLKSIRLLER